MRIEPFVLGKMNQGIAVRLHNDAAYLVNPAYVLDGSEPAEVNDHSDLHAVMLRNGALTIGMDRDQDEDCDTECVRIATKNIASIVSGPFEMHTQFELLAPRPARVTIRDEGSPVRTLAVHTTWNGTYLVNVHHLQLPTYRKGERLTNNALEHMLDSRGVRARVGTNITQSLRLPGSAIVCIYGVDASMSTAFCPIVPDFYGTWERQKPNP